MSANATSSDTPSTAAPAQTESEAYRADMMRAADLITRLRFKYAAVDAPADARAALSDAISLLKNEAAYGGVGLTQTEDYQAGVMHERERCLRILKDCSHAFPTRSLAGEVIFMVTDHIRAEAASAAGKP